VSTPAVKRRDIGHRRKTLLHHQRRICAICGTPFQSSFHKTEDAIEPSIDHVFPLGSGGYDGIGNIVVVHKRCNTAKASKLPTGCEVIWLVAVCARMGQPVKMKPTLPWIIEPCMKALAA
jgi:5-methylcytosine-specific restriction endonuclease McrA